MALTKLWWMDSFDGYPTADFTLWYSDFSNPSTGNTISSGTGRKGTNSLRATLGNNIIGRPLGENAATVVLSFGYRAVNAHPNSGGYYAALLDINSLQVELRPVSTGAWQISRNGTQIGLSTNVMSLNTFYHIAWKTTINNSGTSDLLVNGISWISVSADTQNTANAYATAFRIGPSGSSNFTIDFDDLVVSDDYCGDRHVSISRPDGAGNYSEWTPSAGSNYQNVDDTNQNGDTDYNTGDTVGERDTFSVADAPAGSEIVAVANKFVLKKTDAGARTVASFIRSGGNDFTGTDVSPSDSSYSGFAQIYLNDPNTSAAWTLSNRNSMEPGVKVTS